MFTYADYVEGSEADIEDMFDIEFYLKLVNGAYKLSIDGSSLPPGGRVLHRLEQHLKKTQLPNGTRFNHYRPALYFSKNVSTLADDLNDSVLDRFQRAFDDLNKLL